MPPFASTLPQGKPAATLIVSAEALKQSAAGLEGFVRPSLCQALELANAGVTYSYTSL